jgi:hypothetical protein
MKSLNGLAMKKTTAAKSFDCSSRGNRLLEHVLQCEVLADFRVLRF